MSDREGGTSVPWTARRCLERGVVVVVVLGLARAFVFQSFLERVLEPLFSGVGLSISFAVGSYAPAYAAVLYLVFQSFRLLSQFTLETIHFVSDLSSRCHARFPVSTVIRNSGCSQPAAPSLTPFTALLSPSAPRARSPQSRRNAR